MKNYIALSLIIFIILGCASAEAIFLSEKRYAPLASPELVRIYLDENDLPEKYEKVALIKAEMISGADKEQWRKIKSKCAKIGANGVFIRSKDDAKNGEKIAAAVFGTITTDKMELVAIHF